MRKITRDFTTVHEEPFQIGVHKQEDPSNIELRADTWAGASSMFCKKGDQLFISMHGAISIHMNSRPLLSGISYCDGCC